MNVRATFGVGAALALDGPPVLQRIYLQALFIVNDKRPLLLSARVGADISIMMGYPVRRIGGNDTRVHVKLICVFVLPGYYIGSPTVETQSFRCLQSKHA